ncbi:MAG: dihydroxyacetone kinase subunit DhaL [Bacillota bacterium]|jgi:dihydroxyacetone kinase-like protein
MEYFTNQKGALIVTGLIAAIQEHKQYLSDIDGAIGDGDHGINMNKGFSDCGRELAGNPGDLTHSFRVLARILMGNIGGSMGPLYGMFFKAMVGVSAENEIIDAVKFGAMLQAAEAKVREIGGAAPGDKTLLDSLVPAVAAYQAALSEGQSFAAALDRMREAAEQGRDSTKEMVAMVGRASRLGERSRGVIDAGAASCCLILESMAETIKKLI